MGKKQKSTSAPTIVHIDVDIAWDDVVALASDLDGLFHRMDHPDLAYRDHQAKANRAAVIGGVMTVGIYKIGRRKADVDEVYYIVGSKVSVLREGGIVF